MACESGGNPLATNGTSWGLMQINWPYHTDKFDDPNSLFDPEINIAVAYRIWSDGRTWDAWSCKPW